ncbi:MAG: type II toxin-antitoxin system HicA family toxin [Thiotrichaceae bacterium]
MKGTEFVKKVKHLAKSKGIKCKLDEERGKGSHSTLYYGDKWTIIRNLKDELKTGTLNAMLKQLGITKDEFLST